MEVRSMTVAGFLASKPLLRSYHKLSGGCVADIGQTWMSQFTIFEVQQNWPIIRKSFSKILEISDQPYINPDSSSNSITQVNKYIVIPYGYVNYSHRHSCFTSF